MNKEQTDEENTSLYPEPLSVTLNTSDGYAINQLTGDSIKPLLNSFGDTIKTGIYFPFHASQGHTIRRSKPRIIKAGIPPKTSIASNIYIVPPNLTIIPVDTTKLKKVKAGNPVLIAITEKKMPFHEPHPAKALPLRFKDNFIANVQYLDVDQGMSTSYVPEIIEDKMGNLWFGTDGGGISKYDGVSFSHYSQKEGLSGTVVSAMTVDKNGSIWIVTPEGLNKFDGKNFTLYKNGLRNNLIYSITEDRNGFLWLSTNMGLMKFDGTHYKQYTSKEGLPTDTIFVSTADKNGNLWLGTIAGLVKFDGKEFTHFTKKDGLPTVAVQTLLKDRDSNIWMGSNNGLIKYDGISFTHYSEKEGLSGNLVKRILQDKRGNIWVAVIYGGVNKFNGKTFTQFNLSEGLSNSKINSLFEDKNGNIWFGTDGGGVNKLNDAGLAYLPRNEVLTNNRVRPIIKDKNGNIWFGTEGGGVGKYDAENFTGTPEEFTYYTKKEGFLFLGQRSLLQDTNGNIWIGSIGDGISKYDGASFTNYSLGDDALRNSVYDMLEDKKGNLWFGSRDGSISRYDGIAFNLFTGKEGLPGSIIYSMLEDKKGNLWFCTEGGGVSRYDGTTLINFTEKEGLFCKSVSSIAEDKKGNIWLGTLGAGVCRFDGKKFTYYTEKEGLSNNKVWSLLEDSSGHIWAGTDKGLNRLIPSNDRYVIYNYGIQDGLKAIDFNLHSACIDNNNRIWWGTGKNIAIKDLSTALKIHNVNFLKLNYLEINERFYDYRNLPDSLNEKITLSNVIPFSNYPENLKLSYDLNHLTFHFSAIDWSAPDKIKYSYRMVGLDEQWSKPSEETTADYRNLSHGNYQLQVKAIGQSQVWTVPISYSFTIRPAWWQTWWFKTLMVVAILFIGFLIIRFIYFYKLRKQKTILEKQLAVQYERQRIATEMHDDIGAGLSGIRLLTEMTKNKVKDEQAAEEVEKIYQSVGDISSKMKEVIWSLNTENDNLPNLISYIQKQARLLLENYPCQLTVELPETISAVEINGETRRNIVLMVKEAIHNIIKHSGANKVNLKMSWNNGQFVITVSDNGKGIINQQNDGSGNGMKNMKQRIQKLNGNFFIKNQKGLTLTFEIPLQPSV